jgi:hypothetical protein
MPALAWRSGGDANGLVGALQPLDLLIKLGDPLLALGQLAERLSASVRFRAVTGRPSRQLPRLGCAKADITGARSVNSNLTDMRGRAGHPVSVYSTGAMPFRASKCPIKRASLVVTEWHHCICLHYTVLWPL